MNRRPVTDAAKKARVAEQQNVINALRSGGGVQLYSANPLVAGIERLGNIFAGSTQPTAYAARLGGKEVLKVPGGFDPSSNPQTVNVAGRTFDLAQRGQDAIYIPRTAPGPYGAITNAPTSVTPADRNYESEKRRAAQLAEQDQLAKKYRVADLTKAYNEAKGDEKERIGLEIWATTNPQLAAKLKPGQLGYTEAVSAFQSQSPLGAFAKATGDMQFADKLTPEGIAKGAEALQGIDPYSLQLQTPLTGVSFNAPSQIGVSEAFKSQTPPPGSMEVFTDPLKFFRPDVNQTQLSLLRQAFNRGLK